MRKTVILTALLGMMIPAFGQAEGNLQKAKSEMSSTPLPFACVKSTTYVQPVVPFTPEGDARTYAFSYKDLNGEAQNNNEERNCTVFRRFELGTADLLVVAVARSASTKHFLVSYKEGVPVDYLECAFSFNNDIAMKQWKIDAEGEIQISALKVKEGRQVLFEEEFESIKAQRADHYYVVDADGKFQKVRTVDYPEKFYSKDYLQNKNQNIWDGGEEAIASN